MKKVDAILEMLTRPTLGTEGNLEEVGIMQLVVICEFATKKKNTETFDMCVCFATKKKNTETFDNCLLVWPILKKKGRLEEVGIKSFVTAVVEVTKKTAVVVMTVL